MMVEPPHLRVDCFALPPGDSWLPVPEALEHLRRNLSPVVGVEIVPVTEAAGRVLAEPVIALRDNPPQANAAVDGYGFAHASVGDGTNVLPLVEGRSAAGEPYESEVPPGHAIRILTGAVTPPGVDTVEMQENVTVGDGRIAFRGPVRRGANVRAKGEDITRGAELFPAGHQVTFNEVPMIVAAGHGQVTVFRKLRVGVLSTGDEIRPPGEPLGPGQIHDINRPMLLTLIERWGHEAVDLGHVRDDRAEIEARLDEAAGQADAIVTSGGASAGDEDHLSALLGEKAERQIWRIAIKPGRPLAFGIWRGVPVFGLPGNPVAAFVCALVFGRPSLARLGGGAWPEPRGVNLPAAFAKNKKEGRSEFLRGRLREDGTVEPFRSEGSGLVSGLAWADGLIHLPEAGRKIEKGDLVEFLPWSSFGL